MRDPVKEFHNRIAAFKVVNNIQAAKILFNGKSLLQGRANGIEQDNPTVS
jgi:hypothetical protein